MIWDAFLVSAVARELNDLLTGARLKGHLFRWDDRELLLFFRSGTLRWSLHPRTGWFSFDPPEEPPETVRPLAAEVRGVRALPDERILEIHLQRARGRVRSYRVVLELMTNQWNALILEGPEGRIRHLLWTRNLEERPLVVGREYRPPPLSRRLGIETPLSPEDWEEVLGGKRENEARNALLERVAFTSPINIPYLLEGGVERSEEGEWQPPGLDRWEILRNGRSRAPCVLEIGGDKQPYPITIEGFTFTQFPDLISAIQAVSRESPGGGASSTDPEPARLKQAIHRARGRVKGLRREMDEAEDPEEARMRANLLLARLPEIRRGMAQVVLEGFQGEAVEIPLDPALAPQENAEALYEEAARRERARDRLPGLLREAEDYLARLESLQEGVDRGTVTLETVRDVLPAGTARKKPGQKQEERLPYQSFTSSGGLEIRVGRGSRENDDLTFRHSRPDDIWLHARDSAGAHVILRWDREENPPRRELAEAAILAALNSGARHSGTVPVDWTRRKHVRKPRKAPPGSVVPREVQTVFVEPDPELPERLRAGRPSPPSDSG